jgi:hypothetical protein
MRCRLKFSAWARHKDGSGAGGAGLRESAYRVFAGCPNLVMDLQTDAVLAVFQGGFQDRYSVEVHFTAVFVVHLLTIDL